MILRPYQRDCLDAIREHFRRYDSVLAVLATGLGKTVIGSGLIRAWPEHVSPGRRGRILWLAHREELIRQAAEAIARATGTRPAMEMAGERSQEDGLWLGRDVVVSSVQTLSRPKRRRRFRPEEFGLVIVDEAHHATARSYRTILDYFRKGDPDHGRRGNADLKVLGVTATPRRADDLALGQVFEAVAYEYGIALAVADGWLVPVRQEVVVVEGLDFGALRTVAGDYKQDDLEAVMTAERVLHETAGPAVELAGNRPALVFCVGVEQARKMAAVLNRYKPGSAGWVSGATDKGERRFRVEAYRGGELQFLCNCGVFLEGFDAPSTGLVVMARPTKSLPLYVQMLGRGTRPLPGVVDGLEDAAARRLAIAHSAKPFMTVLDFVGNAQRHGQEATTVNAADALGGRYEEAVRGEAKKNLRQEGGGADIGAALERAEAELALAAEEEERRRRIVARAIYRTSEAVGALSGPARLHRHGDNREPATSKQIWKLKTLGVPWAVASRYTKKQASAEIGRLLVARETPPSGKIGQGEAA